MTRLSGALLQGKRMWVTGGSRGLGRELCVAGAQAGARVAFTWTRDEEGARTTEEAVRAAGGEVHSHRASVLDAAAMERAVVELEAAWGGIDVLVNNAGISQGLPFALMEEEDFDQVMDVNVKGTFLATRAALRGMIRRRAGAILNLGSLAGTRMIEAPAHYCASKAAIRGLTMSLAKEVARYGIRVLCLAPGLLEGGVGRNLPDHRLADYLQHCSLGRVGTFAEVARFAMFLVSDANSYMTGETILMDGGL